MKLKYLIIHLVCLICILTTNAQNSQKANQLIKEGVELHDAGKYSEAIQKYDAAISEDSNNFFAFYEKSFSLSSLKKCNESIAVSKELIKKFPDEPSLKLVYVSYANCLDEIGKGKEALKVYDQGIKKFPDFHLLYFNKGISLNQQDKYDEAIKNFQKAIILEPNHVGSHTMLGRNLFHTNKVPAILALMRMLVLEPQSERAAQNWEMLQKVLMPEEKKEIVVSMDMLKNITSEQKKENSFSAEEFMLLTLNSGMTVDNKEVSGLEKLNLQLNAFFTLLAGNQSKNTGFYWEYYVPYFADMQKQSQVTTFMYIMQASARNKEVQDWLNSHGKEIEAFYTWNKGYQWPALK